MHDRSGLNNTDTRGIVRALVGSVPDLVVSSTVSIVGAKAPLVRHIGSGTLVAVADARFVLTAAHVIREASRDGLTIGVGSSANNHFTALTGKVILSDDGFDIALCQLDDRQVSRMVGAEFVRVADALFEINLSGGYFVVSGFPAMWSTTSDSKHSVMKARLLQYGTYAFAGNCAALGGYDPTKHFLLEATPAALLDQHGNETSFNTRSGLPAQMPTDLKGVSGCSVWIIGNLNRTPTVTSIPARIVGVETGVYAKRGAIKATRWSSVTTLIYNAFPSLRPAIELYS